MIDSHFNVDGFSIDTLKKYQALFYQISGFAYSSDALEVFRTSSLMQSVEDKNLLLRIIETYKILGQVKEGVLEYYDLKKTVFIPLVLEADSSTVSTASTDEQDVRQMYNYMLSQKSTVNFCRVASRFLDAGYFEARIAEVDSTISMLRSVYD